MATSKNASGANGFTAELKDSVLVKIAALGAVLVFLAIAIEGAIRAGILVRGMSGVWATIFLLWGAALVFGGTVGRTLIWWRRR